MVNSYHQISQKEAARMMEKDDGHVIVDVRRQDEYDAGHIPGAILVPNESIDDESPTELPDKNRIILIYCRSRNRSKQAVEKLFKMGYTKIYEFGGIIDWTGEIVTENSEEQVETVDFHEAEMDPMKPTAVLVMEVNGKQFYTTPANNSSAEGLPKETEFGNDKTGAS